MLASKHRHHSPVFITVRHCAQYKRKQRQSSEKRRHVRGGVDSDLSKDCRFMPIRRAEWRTGSPFMRKFPPPWLGHTACFVYRVGCFNWLHCKICVRKVQIPLTLQRLQTDNCDGSGETKRATDTICTIAQESNTKTRVRLAVEITVLQTRREGG